MCCFDICWCVFGFYNVRIILGVELDMRNMGRYFIVFFLEIIECDMVGINGVVYVIGGILG